MSIEITWLQHNDEVHIISPAVIDDIVHFSIQDNIAINFNVGNIFPSNSLTQYDKSQFSGDLSEEWVWEVILDTTQSSLPEIHAINQDIDDMRHAGYDSVADRLQARLHSLCGIERSAAQDHSASQYGLAEDTGGSMKLR